MRNIVAMADGKITRRAFEIGESFSDLIGGGLYVIYVFNRDIDLLDLRIEIFDLIKVNNDGLIKIYTVKIDRIFSFLQSTNNDKFVACKRKCFADRFTRAKKLECKRVANNSRF